MIRIEAALRGELAQIVQQEGRVLMRATNSGIRRTTTILQREIRKDLRAARLGGLVNTVRRSVKPPKGKNPREYPVEGFVYSSADYKRASGKVDIVLAYEEGAEIRPFKRKWICIPTENVGFGRGGRGGGRARQRPEDFPSGSLHFVPTRNPNVALLVYRQKGQKDAVMFLLLKTARVKRRFSRQRADQIAQAELFNLIAEAYERFGRKAGIIDDGDA